MGQRDSTDQESQRKTPKKRVSPLSDEADDGPLIEGEGKYGKRYKVPYIALYSTAQVQCAGLSPQYYHDAHGLASDAIVCKGELTYGYRLP